MSESHFLPHRDSRDDLPALTKNMPKTLPEQQSKELNERISFVLLSRCGKNISRNSILKNLALNQGIIQKLSREHEIILKNIFT
jgi:hypothetical protein